MILLLAALLSTADVTPAEPAGEAAIDAFVAALPPSQRAEAPDSVGEAEAAGLRDKNLGKEKSLEPIIAGYSRCMQKVAGELATRALRESARRMGDSKLAQLTAFYRGADFVRFAALVDQEKGGKELSEAEIAEMKAIAGRYPLEEYSQVMQQLTGEMFTDETAWAGFERCIEERNAALRSADLAY